jgi:hypothetical protein
MICFKARLGILPSLALAGLRRPVLRCFTASVGIVPTLPWRASARWC